MLRGKPGRDEARSIALDELDMLPIAMLSISLSITPSNYRQCRALVPDTQTDGCLEPPPRSRARAGQPCPTAGS